MTNRLLLETSIEYSLAYYTYFYFVSIKNNTDFIVNIIALV